MLRFLPAKNVVSSSLSLEKFVEQSSNISKTTLQYEEKCDGPTNILQQERWSNLKLDFCQWRFWTLCTGPNRLFVWTVLPRHFASFANLCGLPPGSENQWLFFPAGLFLQILCHLHEKMDVYRVYLFHCALKGIGHPKIENSPIFYSPLCQWRLWWHFLTRPNSPSGVKQREGIPPGANTMEAYVSHWNVKNNNRSKTYLRTDYVVSKCLSSPI